MVIQSTVIYRRSPEQKESAVAGLCKSLKSKPLPSGALARTDLIDLHTGSWPRNKMKKEEKKLAVL